jgi:hypothetical protein
MNDTEQAAGRPLAYRCAACGRALRLPSGTDITRCLPVCSGCRPKLDADRMLRALVYLADEQGMTLAEALAAGESAPFSVAVL